jgi:hypothetical protein
VAQKGLHVREERRHVANVAVVGSSPITRFELILTHSFGFHGLFSAALARQRSGETKESAPESQYVISSELHIYKSVAFSLGGVIMARKVSTKKEAHPVAEQILIRCHPDLRARVLKDVETLSSPSVRVTMSEIIVKILADHYEDAKLAVIPKKPMGRPPKEHAAVA